MMIDKPLNSEGRARAGINRQRRSEKIPTLNSPQIKSVTQVRESGRKILTVIQFVSHF